MNIMETLRQKLEAIEKETIGSLPCGCTLYRRIPDASIPFMETQDDWHMACCPDHEEIYQEMSPPDRMADAIGVFWSLDFTLADELEILF